MIRERMVSKRVPPVVIIGCLCRTCHRNRLVLWCSQLKLLEKSWEEMAMGNYRWAAAVKAFSWHCDVPFQTINEGLITPVIRRKQFNQPTALTCNVSGASSHPNSPNAGRLAHSTSNSNTRNGPVSLVTRGREALEALFVQHQKTSASGNEGLGRRYV